MTAPMMKCGHAANGTCSRSGGVDFNPPLQVCVICFCLEQAETQPNLEGRKARCSYQKKRDGSSHTDDELKPSSLDLTFFSHHPDREFDEFYCGCWGWD